MERDGHVIAEPSVNVQADTITEFLNANISPTSTLITDGYASCGFMRYHVKEHLTVDHSIQYVDGIKHTNTIEGFWSLLKRAWFGTYHHYTRKWAIAYVVEACFKYNMRRVYGPVRGLPQGRRQGTGVGVVPQFDLGFLAAIELAYRCQSRTTVAFSKFPYRLYQYDS